MYMYMQIDLIGDKAKMGNRPLQNVRKHGPITNQAGGNYMTSALDMIGQFFYKYQ